MGSVRKEFTVSIPDELEGGELDCQGEASCRGDIIANITPELEGNEKAIRFYEHMGFRPTGHRIVDERDGGTLVEIEMCLHHPGGHRAALPGGV